MFTLRKVESSAIHSAGYDEDTHTLTLVFNSNDTKEYLYPDVPKEIAEGLFKADSVGRYYHQHIKQYSVYA